MKVFITGITGFIGSNLANKLLTQGHEVHALVRKDNGREHHPNLRYHYGSLGDKETIRVAMKGCETGFHLAAYAKPWAKDPGLIYKINYVGALHVFESARESGLGTLVFTSSAATLSPSNGSGSVDEATLRTIPFFNEYERSKSMAEAKAVEFSARGTRIVTVNPSRVYGFGPLNESNSVTKMILQYAAGKWRIIPGDGKSIGNYVYIDDVVNGHLLAAENGRAGERYILGGENLTFNEFFYQLQQSTGIKHNMFHLPLSCILLATRSMEMMNKVTGIPPRLTTDWAKKFLSNWSLSSQKAASELGYHFTPFGQGVELTLESFSTRKYSQ